MASNSKIHQHRWPVGGSSTGPVRGVYIFHGLGEHGARYEHVAKWFVARGYRVGSHDHPAHGRSPGNRGVLESDNAISDCAIEQLASFEQECDGPVLLLGHSLGGALAAKLALSGAVNPAGLILSAPAFEPRLSAWERGQLELMYFFAKNLTVTARLSGPVLTHDETMRQAWRADPLITRAVSARLIKWLVETGSQALEQAPQLAVPTLLLVPLADAIVNSGASQQFANRAPAATVTMHTYDDLYHEILNESPADRQRVFDDVDQWLSRPDLQDHSSAGESISSDSATI